MLLVGLFYIIVPVILILVTALVRRPNLISWVLSTSAFGLVIVFVWSTSRWDIVGMYLRNLFAILFVMAAIIGYKRITLPAKPSPKFAVVINYGVNLLLIIFMGVLSFLSLKGYQEPDNVIALSSPLRGNNNVVLHGGGSPFINGHFKIRPQNYALDVISLDRFGKRASTISGGSELEDYEIYGASVFSPCDGTVLLTVDGFEDLQPPKRDVENLAGNHILLDCGEAEVLLAHLMQNSIVVKPGETISDGALIGKVGNTGNTSEPHLHMHAEKGDESATILNGQAIPFTIDGRFLVRGSKF